MTKSEGKINMMARPRLEKVVVNSGIGRIITQAKNQDEVLGNVVGMMSLITGQKPKVVKTAKSIASFKLRKGMPVGIMATLRGRRAEDFVKKLVNVIIPRLRDFRGLDERGVVKNSLTIGFKEHIVFPEVANESYKVPFSLQITVVSSAKKKEDALAFFKTQGFRFKMK